MEAEAPTPPCPLQRPHTCHVCGVPSPPRVGHCFQGQIPRGFPLRQVLLGPTFPLVLPSRSEHRAISRGLGSWKDLLSPLHTHPVSAFLIRLPLPPHPLPCIPVCAPLGPLPHPAAPPVPIWTHVWFPAAPAGVCLPVRTPGAMSGCQVAGSWAPSHTSAPAPFCTCSAGPPRHLTPMPLPRKPLSAPAGLIGNPEPGLPGPGGTPVHPPKLLLPSPGCSG